MFHYLFTNDLRISNLQIVLMEAAKCFRYNKVPSAAEDKNANNNMNTLGFYFNLTSDSNCAKACCNGDVRKVVLNFIKKFQFPNPRTSASLKDCIDDGIQLAPMRIILRILYIMKMICPEQAYLTKKEIADYVFFNEDVAKNATPNIPSIVNKIIENRDQNSDESIPDDDVLEQKGYFWKQCKRQVREMVKVLCWSGCVVEDEKGNIMIQHDNLSRDNEADLFEIITYSEFWKPDPTKNAEENKASYQKYMDIDVVENKKEDNNETKPELIFNTGINVKMPRNRIIFGAPGTGKSFMLNEERKKLLGSDNETDYERVTFHPDYSYANFVGTYKPVMVSNRKAAADKDVDYVISILNDNGKTAQEKYDVLFEKFKDDGLTRLPVLLGLYTDEMFKTRKQDGTDTAGDNSLERNHGKAIRKYVSLLTGQDTSSDIAYEYVPGPFMRVYVNALKSARTANPKPYLLIIEEINRANVAAVFGDVFQLLDRDDDEVSEYPIQASEDIKKYLARELGGNPEDYNKIKIPDNMFIWATMNSADQGVFPMDTAFKRRWDFTYIGIDDNDKEIRGKYVVLGSKASQKVEWNKLRKAINRFLAKQKINEDKQLGPYFLSRKVVIPESGDEIDRNKFCEAFKNKVIMYLFEDAAKQKRPSLFEGCFDSSTRYSEICREFDEKGIGIFNHEIGLATDPEDITINGTGTGATAKETE